MLLLLGGKREATDLCFTKKFCLPGMRPSSGLINGMEVSTVGGSFASWVK